MERFGENSYWLLDVLQGLKYLSKSAACLEHSQTFTKEIFAKIVNRF